MLKALFLDMDETLCDTHGANKAACQLMAEELNRQFGATIEGERVAAAYLKGIYRNWTDAQHKRYMPIIEKDGEGVFRNVFIDDLLKAEGIQNSNPHDANTLQTKFDSDRLDNFHFLPGILDFLVGARELFTLVVITNGPEFSQLPKIDAINLHNYVDHIIVGGQEPEQKPAKSIFLKALKLAKCEAHEAIHVGDSLAADIAGANNSGITSLWIQHQQPLDAELGINPDHTVVHPSEIPDTIRSLHAC